METDIRQFLTDSELFRTACRASYLTTFDLLLCQSLATANSVPAAPGYLDSLPLLRGCAPQIQLELLLQTWGETRQGADQPLSIIAQCVCFASLTRFSELVTAGSQRTIDRALQGSGTMNPDDLQWLPSRLRTLQITLPFAAQAAVLAPETSLPSEELEAIRVAGGISCEDLEQLLALTGRWRMNPAVLTQAATLLTTHELELLETFLHESPELLLPGTPLSETE